MDTKVVGQTCTPSIVVQSQSQTTSNMEKVKTDSDGFMADLDAKADDVLSRIRATEERMAAASRSDNSSKCPGHSLGRDLRASAVAAATANIRGEEDEESVMSRVEQVAALEATVIDDDSKSELPPPPPLPANLSLGAGVDDSLAKRDPRSSLIDLDLDSRIQLLMNNTSKPTTQTHPLSNEPPSSNEIQSSASYLLPALLAKRKMIADKLAANKNSRSLIGPCHPVTTPPSSPSALSSMLDALNNTNNKHDDDADTNKNNKRKTDSNCSDELYDLLGV